MFQHFLATWRAGWRSHAFRAIAILTVGLIFCAWLASSFSGRHPQTVALDVGISGLRFVTVLLMLFWSQELIGKEIDRRTVFVALTYPLDRTSYLLGRYFGMLAMLTLAVAVIGAGIYGMVQVSSGGYAQAFGIDLGWGYLITLVFVLVDAAAIAAFVVLLSSIATTSLLPMACGAVFAIVARSYGSVLAFLADKQGEGADIAHIYVPLIDLFSWLIPDLGRLDVRALALYGPQAQVESLLWPPVLATLYAGTVLCIACVVFARREFT